MNKKEIKGMVSKNGKAQRDSKRTGNPPKIKNDILIYIKQYIGFRRI
jgi:hypothetical protein